MVCFDGLIGIYGVVIFLGGLGVLVFVDDDHVFFVC